MRRTGVRMARALNWIATLLACLGAIAFLAVAASAIGSWFVPSAAASFAQAAAPAFETDYASTLRGAPVLISLVAVLLAVFTLTCDRLRRIARTVQHGEPFVRANVRSLRAVAALLAGLQVATHAIRIVLASIQHKAPEIDLNIAGWLSVLVVLVLAEVFAEGARLREEAELTV